MKSDNLGHADCEFKCEFVKRRRPPAPRARFLDSPQSAAILDRHMGTFVKVATLGELAPGSCRMVEVNGKEVALFNVDGKVYATSNICPHQGGPLAEGMVEGTTVICPWHAWAFDVRSGTSPVNPRAKVDTYPVKLEGGDVYVDA